MGIVKGIFAAIGIGGCLVVTIAMMVALSFGGRYLYLKYWATTEQNLVTEVTRNTNQYVTTQQTKIQGLLDEYNQLDVDIIYYEGTPDNVELVAGMKRQQVEKVRGMCDAASKLDAQYVPQPAQPLMRVVGCWNG